MNRYEIVWRDDLTNTARNVVNADPRPTNIEADSYSVEEDGKGNAVAVVFYDDSSPLLTLFEFPLLIRRVVA